MKRVIGLAAAIGLAAGVFATGASAQQKTLDIVKARGALNCGINSGTPGFSVLDDKGVWSGFDVDFCRAVSSAIFGDPNKVNFKPLSAKDRFTALQSGEIDMLIRNTTWTMSRDSSLGLSFAGITYYDGQGFMVPKKLGVKSAKELNGASVCVATGTTTELNLADYFRLTGMTYKPVVFEKNDEVNAAYESGRCDVYTTDQSSLYAQRLRFKDPEEHIVLPEIISKEPLGPSVRQGDAQWFTIVKWVYFALLNAEEAGINSKNLDEMMKSTNPDVRRILGVEGEFGKGISLDADWVAKIVKGVGNFAELYERNLGPATPLKIARGANNLWTKGGLQYAPPIR